MIVKSFLMQAMRITLGGLPAADARPDRSPADAKPSVP
jgi:hypothetical protein